MGHKHTPELKKPLHRICFTMSCKIITVCPILDLLLRLSPSEWENFKKSKSDCPPCPTRHAFLQRQSCGGFTLSCHGMLTGERISRVGCKERPRARTGAPFTRATLCSSWLCILATSTPRVRVNTSAGSIYFHCLHSAQQINLFIQTHTEKWLINARARPCFFAFTR